MTKDSSSWTFFSNHAHVYFLLTREKDMVMREIAYEVGITERTVQGIIDDLEEEGYIERYKKGRTNQYNAVPGMTLRHKLEKDLELEDLAKLIKKAIKSKG